jgi:hypothetical protein
VREDGEEEAAIRSSRMAWLTDVGFHASRLLESWPFSTATADEDPGNGPPRLTGNVGGMPEALNVE